MQENDVKKRRNGFNQNTGLWYILKNKDCKLQTVISIYVGTKPELYPNNRTTKEENRK